MTNEWALVAPYARNRRKELRLTQEDIRVRRGPSAALVRQVENGTYEAAMQPGVERAYEAALEWKAGSIESIKNGGRPYPMESKPTAADAAARLEHLQTVNRRSDEQSKLVFAWYQARSEMNRLETEFAMAFGLGVNEARDRLKAIADAIENAAENAAQEKEGGSEDGDTSAQKMGDVVDEVPLSGTSEEVPDPLRQ